MSSYAGVSANVASLILPPSAVSGVSWAQLFTSGGNAGAVWDPRELGEMSTSVIGGTFGVSLGDTVGFVVDQARGGTAALGAELLSTGVTLMSGSATAATYNTSTGVGTVTRVDGANQSYVRFATTAAKTYRVTVQNTSTAIIFVRDSSLGGSVMSLAAGETATANLTGSVNYNITSSAGTLSFVVVSIRELPGIHMVAPSDPRRATLVGYNGGSVPSLYANGSHGYASSAPLDLSGSDEVTVIMQVRSLLDGASQMYLESTAQASVNSGTFHLFRQSANTYQPLSRGTASSLVSSAAFVRPDSALLVARAKISTDALTLSRNGVQVATSSADQGTGTYTSPIVNWMARNLASPTLFATAEFGPLAIIGGALSTELYDMMVAKAAYA